MIQEQLTLAPKTSYHIGGDAQYYSAPSSMKELQETLRFAQPKRLPLFILGKGTNILVSDTGYEGLIIDTSNLNSIAIDKTLATVQAGASFTKLIMQCVNDGLGGLEELAGIPGSVGGAVLMNAGAYGQTISEVIRSVTWMDLTSQTLTTTPKEKLTFGYRTSTFRETPALIIEATLELLPQKKRQLRKIVQEIQAKRRKKQPLQFPSCGSVFKRPPGNYAGALIEEVGLKGFQVGDAQISEKHANFIINRGKASAKEVRDLISHTIQTVYKKSGILLETEVIFVGTFDAPLWHPDPKDNR